MQVGCSAWTHGIQTWNGTRASFIISPTKKRMMVVVTRRLPAIRCRSRISSD